MVEINWYKKRLILQAKVLKPKAKRPPLRHRLIGYEAAFPINRRHEHLVRPFLNDKWSKGRVFTQQTMTTFLLIGSVYIGYAYGRLKHDEALQRKMHTRYTNFMWLFTVFSDKLEHYYSVISNKFWSFDSAQMTWRARNSKIAEFWAYRALQEEIYTKQAEKGDVITQSLLKLDKLDLDHYAKSNK